MIEQKLIWQERLNELRNIKPTGDLMADMEIQDEILELERNLGIKAQACSLDGDECESCSG